MNEAWNELLEVPHLEQHSSVLLLYTHNSYTQLKTVNNKLCYCRWTMQSAMSTDTAWRQHHQQWQLLYSSLSGTTWVSWYYKTHSPIHIYHDHQPSFISFLHILQSTASFLFSLPAWQSFAQPPSKSSMVYLWVWNPPLRTPHISANNRTAWKIKSI